MGVRTLEEFVEDLDGIVGEGRKREPWLKRRVNEGYTDVATALHHESTRERITLEVERGTREYEMPENLIGLESVFDVTSDKRLPFIDSSNMDNYQEGRIGRPQLWSFLGVSLIIWPDPDRKYELRIIGVIEPLPMVEYDDITALATRWDNAVGLMAAHYAFLHLHEDERSQMYLERVIAYMGARIKDEDVRKSPSMPLNVPRTFHEFVRGTRRP